MHNSCLLCLTEEKSPKFQPHDTKPKPTLRPSETTPGIPLLSIVGKKTSLLNMKDLNNFEITPKSLAAVDALNPRNDQPILILRFDATTNNENEGQENPPRNRAGVVNRPSLDYHCENYLCEVTGHLRRETGSGMEMDYDTFGGNIGNIDMTSLDNVDAAVPRGKKGHGGGGHGGSGPPPPEPEPDPVGDYIDPNLTLASVGGLPEHVSYLRRAIIYPMVHKEAFAEWGIESPKGILFHGPPGTGKTLLAKAMANEIKRALGGIQVAFFYQKGCESNSQYFGESEENLRSLFQQAIENRPAVIFFDEIDGLCPDRDKAGQVSEAYVGVVTALLGLIDSVKRGEVFLIGATNRLDSVDAAIRRPGRFDKDISFQLPDIEGRKAIIDIHTRPWLKDHPVEELRQQIAQKTIGYSGADIQKLCKEVLGQAITRCGLVPASKVTIIPQDWSMALEKMSPSRSDVLGSTVISAKPPLPVMWPLIQTVVQEVIQKLHSLLPNATGVYPNAMMGMRSFVVYEQELESEVYLNHVVMNGILSDPSLSKIPVFALDMPHFAERVNNGTTPMKTVVDIIRQASTCDKPCILFVPGLNWMNAEIARFTKEKENFIFVRQLMTLAGSQAILVATVIGRLQDVCPELKSLFTSSGFYPVRKPDGEERRAFFYQIFVDLINDEDKNAKQRKMSSTNSNPIKPKSDVAKKFEKQLKRAVDVTINHPCDYLLKLYDTLQKEKVKYTTLNEDGVVIECSYEEIHKGFWDILDLYNSTRLQ